MAGTAERELLALAKIGRDVREIGMDRRNMLDLVQLDRRTDRILPNGYCLLPPTRSCGNGNACHGCDHFATDRTEPSADDGTVFHTLTEALRRERTVHRERVQELEQRLAAAHS
ncbi:hypothetical protein [Streptomyces sp. NPDC002187]|uniref:hypothetical protein n=1 Tax=Streptomyces sp. NPDC002187 TaxID=3364637 RepID=UPI003682F791